MDICLVANKSCTTVAKCGFELHSSVHGSIIDNKYCLQLELQWMPNGIGHGSLLVTKELTMDHEVLTHVIIFAVYNFVLHRVTFLLLVKILR